MVDNIDSVGVEHAADYGKFASDLIVDLTENPSVFGVPSLYENKTFVPDASKPQLICVLGTSGVGKDSIIAQIIELGLTKEVKAATTRPRRINIEGSVDEAEDKYVWVRPRSTNEDIDSYCISVEKEYELLEYSVIGRHIYGTPKSSIDEALSGVSVAGIAVCDVRGFKKLSTELNGIAKCVGVLVLPDNYNQLTHRTRLLNDPETRDKEALELLIQAPQVADYYIKNSREPNGLRNSVAALRHVIHYAFGGGNNE